MVEETKHDILLKRIQVIIAILGGLTAVILGAYNINKAFFSKKEAAPVVVTQQPQDSPIKSALEDVGASWIKKIGKADSTKN